MFSPLTLFHCIMRALLLKGTLVMSQKRRLSPFSTNSTTLEGIALHAPKRGLSADTIHAFRTFIDTVSYSCDS